MINQIYHTSHCGSTLLAFSLSNSIPTYSEPSWCHDIISEKKVNFCQKLNEYNKCLIKLPSGLCHFSYKNDYKKIFLYRNLKNHLFKLLVLNNDIDNYLNYYYEYFVQNIHPKLKNINFDTKGKKHVFLWLNRFFWMKESNNTLLIESNDFFLNKKKTINKVCDFLNIEYDDKLSLGNFDVKSSGLNHNEIELSKINLNERVVNFKYPSYGVIEDSLCLCDDQILDLIAWSKTQIYIPEIFI